MKNPEILLDDTSLNNVKKYYAYACDCEDIMIACDCPFVCPDSPYQACDCAICDSFDCVDGECALPCPPTFCGVRG